MKAGLGIPAICAYKWNKCFMLYALALGFAMFLYSSFMQFTDVYMGSGCRC